MQLPDSIFDKPALFPEKIDLQNKNLYFCNMEPDNYRQSPFLDHRTVKKNDESKVIGLDQLMAENPIVAPESSHYIFHNAFCCSTLFSRCLNSVESALVLREPNVLMEQASIYRFSGTQMLPAMDMQFADNIFKLLSVLMARRFEPCDEVIIKPTDSCNNMMSQLLATNPENKGLIIYSDIEHFLTAIFKNPQREEWVKVRAVELSLDEMKKNGNVKANPETLNSYQKSALVWVLHINKFKNILASEIGSKVKTINNEVFMKSPVDVIEEYLDFLGIAVDHDKLSDDVAKIMKGHSKSSELSYSNEQRENEYLEARNKYDNEIKESIAWANEMFGVESITCNLENKLA